MQIRFIEPNRLTATGMSKPVGRSNSSPGPPPGDFDTRSVTAQISRSGLTGSRDPRQLALLVERGDEFVQVFEHVSSSIRAVRAVRAHALASDSIFSAIRVASSSARRPASPSTSGARPRPDGADEIRELAPQRLVALDRQRPALDGRPLPVAAHQPPAFDFLRRVVDRDVGVGLEEPDLPHALLADPAGRDVGDAAGREPQPRVRDVVPRRQHRHADRFDRCRPPTAPARG